MMESTQWIERSRQGDREAFGKIVDRYQGMVSAVTLNVVGDYAQSEDLAQETFLTVWKKLPELREPEKLAAWIYGIARRTALHWIEKQQRNPLRNAAELDGDTAVDPRRELEAARQKNEQSLELVWSTVRKLPEMFREPLLLYYRYSKSAAEIAESMNLSEDAVCQRLSRGRKMLKAEVEKQVESVLESTRPDTAFTLAVLASLPLAATATGCTATGVGAAAGTQSAWSLFWTLGLFLLAPIILITGGFMGLWTALKHSPTVRTRRFMCRVALQWYLFMWLFMLIKLKIDHGYGGWDTHGGAFFFGYFGILIAYCSWLVHRWRMLLEEDAGLRPMPVKLLEKTSLSRFWLRWWYWGVLLFVLPFSIALAFDLIHEYLRDPGIFDVFGEWTYVYVGSLAILSMTIPLGVFFAVGYGLRTAKNEESLLQWYPKNGRAFLPKPKEKTEMRLFFSDLLLMFSTAVLPMIPLVMSAMILNGLFCWVLFSTMMMVVAAMIASHSAGIPGKRLSGYAKLWMIVGLIYAVLLMTGQGCFFMVPIGLGIKVSMQILFCIVYFGAALIAFVGTYVCRKKKIDKEPDAQAYSPELPG